MRIEKHGAYSSAVLPAVTEDLSERDGSLCYQITLGVLRRQMMLDRIIDVFAQKRKLDLEVRIAARIGLFQLRYLDRVPEYSAINESVNLVRMAGKRSATGFLNALLRREQRVAAAFVITDPLEKLSLETSHPKWLLERWASHFGVDAAAGIARANNEMPALSYRYVNAPPQSGAPEHARSRFVQGCYLAERFDAGLFAKAASGEIYFQDEASQMAALAVPVQNGSSVLDVCAAPGSKTTLLAARPSGAGVLFAAGDVHLQRLQLMKTLAGKQGLGNINLVQYDAERGLPFADGSFDSVLVDAPCSGTGTIRHNPEIRYRVTVADLEDLPHKQLAILRNASKLVRPGGMIVYSTCSLEPEENEAVCGAFIADGLDFEKVLPSVAAEFRTPDGYARTFPHRDAMDGFFIASFRRRAA